MSNFNLMHGDVIEQLFLLPDNSIDSIVTDAPYELNFMGKSWDSTGIAYSVPMWKECLRVLKPGGHLLSFGGSRTYHRMACAIEDAGFQIRDQIMWITGQGFPKSMNLDLERGKKFCGCKPSSEREVHTVLNPDVSKAVDISEGGGEVLQSVLQEQSTPIAGWQEPTSHEGQSEPRVEGWSNAQTQEGQLSVSSVSPLPCVGNSDGTQGWVRNGAPSSDGTVVRVSTNENRSSTPSESQSPREQSAKSGVVARQQKPQVSGAWSLCGRCSLPMVAEGLGTALKPAHEPIVLARKPLIGTVAANVLEHGTGALNIGASRIPGESVPINKLEKWSGFGEEKRPDYTATVNDAGRWPANFLHDGLDETWAKFFYCAKANKKDRNEGCQDLEQKTAGEATDRQDGSAGLNSPRAGAGSPSGAQNFHPTVKPTELMRYLCRLVTPPQGTVLDPFTGSGSTGKAAIKEGFKFIGIDNNEEYLKIAEARISKADVDAQVVQ